MKAFRALYISAALISFLSAFQTAATAATVAGPKISEVISGRGNKHNLSTNAWPAGTTSYSDTSSYLATANPNTYKADTGGDNPRRLQICVFCHTPHNANVEGGAPLWNRSFSSQTFSRYSSATLEIRLTAATRTAAGYDTPGWQPDGSSKLCLSCHDGVSSLGTLVNGGVIAMDAGGGDTITGIASFNPSGNKMKTGHHPVSFVYDASVKNAINASASKSTYKLPTDATAVPEVKLDKNNKMQCITCHNAHQNQSSDTECHGGTCDATFTRKKAPFWVLGGGADASADRDKVCLACHPIDAEAGFTSPWPTP